MMSSVDQTIVATALPAIQHDLAAQVNWSSWTITIYALGQVLVMPLAGKLGDQYGRKRIFLGAAALFTTASLCCGLATNIYLLIVLRAIQAIGGGAFMPSATGIVTETFGENRERAVGLFSSIFPIGGVGGPALAGPGGVSLCSRAHPCARRAAIYRPALHCPPRVRRDEPAELPLRRRRPRIRAARSAVRGG